MSFTDAIKSCFSQYAGFNGRARRSEYWFWYLFSAIVGSVVSIIAKNTSDLVSLVPLVILVPTLAVEFRRLHDTGRSGAFVLLNFIPLIGQIILIIFCVRIPARVRINTDLIQRVCDTFQGEYVHT